MNRATSIALRVGVPMTAATALLAATIVLAYRTTTTPAPQPHDDVVVCIEQPAPPPIVDPVPPIDVDVPQALIESPSVALPMPADDVYARLAACLRDAKVWPDIHVTVDQVRYWVEIEKDPVWRENGAWWLPLSGEGDPQMPSGIYISVPDVGTTCGGALIN